MVLINGLSIDEINAALIRLQKEKSQIIESGETSQTIQNVTITQSGGGSGTDWSGLIENVQQSQVVIQNQLNETNAQIEDLKEKNAELEEKNEQLEEMVNNLSAFNVVALNFDAGTRTLYLTLADGTEFSSSIPQSNVINENYIYDPDDVNHRLKISANGLTSQKNVGTFDSPVWEDYANISVDRNGSVIINNSTMRTLDYGVKVNGTIYHFEDAAHPTYEEVAEGGTPTNPENIAVDGIVVQTNDNCILMTTSSKKMVQGSVTKDLTSFYGNIVFFSKANVVIIGDKGFKTDGTVSDAPSPLTGYNEAMRETSTIDSSKTVGEYLGLTSEQVTQGIFN